jgi:hypothetical protein
MVLRYNFKRDLSEQKKFIEGENSGVPYIAKRMRIVVENGVKVKKMTELSRIPQWYHEDNGTYFTILKYGVKFLTNSKGEKLIRVGTSLDALEEYYDKLLDATDQGKMDEALINASPAADKSNLLQGVAAAAATFQEAPKAPAKTGARGAARARA